jgi:pyruvate dehydrogenase E2 component (dihydrolipoamide acetyltransferase)
MPVEFTMPKLGLTMEEGTIVEWMVPADSAVSPGTAVVLVDTDKVQTEVEIPDGGRLVFVGEVGSTYKCGEVIGYVLAEGESAPTGAAAPAVAVAPAVVATAPTAAATPVAAPRSADGRVLASPYARVRAKELGVDLASVSGTGPGGRIVVDDVVVASQQPKSAPAIAPLAASAPAAVPAGGWRQTATPPITYAASELARLVGLDLRAHSIRSTAPDGRISREDVAAYVRGLLAGGGTPSAAQPVAPPASQEPTEIVALKGMRGTIASRMRASLQDMAQLTLMMDADMDAVVADRSARKAAGAVVPSFTDYVIASCARALREHPRVNSQVTPDGIALLPRVNVGMAVALDEGLVVPVVPDTDVLTVADLAPKTAALADAARRGALKLTDYEGGTFSVSTLGMFGVDGFTPVINPPNAAIMGVGRLRDDVAWSDDGVLRRVKRLTLSLTWDHRVFDGAPAAEFVRTVTRFLDDPSTLD